MLNEVNLIGRLTKDPEIRYTQSQKPVATFTVACEADFKDSDGNKPVDFIDCVAWNGSATYLEKYGHKGDVVVVNGRIHNNNWQDKDGKKRTKNEINVRTVYLFGGKRDVAENATTEAQTFTEVEDEGELPF